MFPLGSRPTSAGCWVGGDWLTLDWSVRNSSQLKVKNVIRLAIRRVQSGILRGKKFLRSFFLLQQTVKRVSSLGVERWVPPSNRLVWGFGSSLCVMSVCVRVSSHHTGEESPLTFGIWIGNWKQVQFDTDSALSGEHDRRSITEVEEELT